MVIIIGLIHILKVVNIRTGPKNDLCLSVKHEGVNHFEGLCEC